MMKQNRLHFLPLLLTGILVLLGNGCRDSTSCCGDSILPPPSGVHSVTGDSFVEILWNEIHHPELDEYKIYRSGSSDGTYNLIGYSQDTNYIDDDVVNGRTYFYAVTACDYGGGETELSYEDVYDTPRPEGWNLYIYDEDDLAGVDFSDYQFEMIQPWDAPRTDMFLLWHDGHYCLASGADVVQGDQVTGTDIQYGGYVESLDEIDWAPEYGWSLEQADTVRLFEGHSYHVWIWDNHFAKFRVDRIGDDFVVIDWAYQIDEGNPELDVQVVGSDAGGERSADESTLTKTSRSGSNQQLGVRRTSRSDADVR